MSAALKRIMPVAVLSLAAATLAGCYVGPAPYTEGGYYAEPRPAYVAPRYDYGPRWTWHRNRWHRNRHHWD
ncbi:hypothetical protein [Dongia sp.]|uniref:hypothetical protein n=1 Tax=Dongia sp. TaxID=1977262 RepID=UPI00375059FA